MYLKDMISSNIEYLPRINEIREKIEPWELEHTQFEEFLRMYFVHCGMEENAELLTHILITKKNVLGRQYAEEFIENIKKNYIEILHQVKNWHEFKEQ